MYKRVMRRFDLPLIGVICALALTPAQLSAGGSLAEKIDEIVRAEAGFDLFSGTVVVADRGRIIYETAAGEAGREDHIPFTERTRFNISSVQKTFIATVIMQLVQAGEIALEDPLSRFLPDCSIPGADRIQIQHLLNHSSGLGEYRDDPDYQARADQFRTIDEVLSFVCGLEPGFEPGEQTRYSNAGYLLLKAIIEKKTGKSLRHNLTERIFRPLGMKNTRMFAGGEEMEDRATGYDPAEDGESRVRVTDEPSAYAGGGIYTTGRDLLLFDQALYGDLLLDENHKQIMFTPVGPQPNVAFGWFVVPWGGTTVVMHSGGSGGFSTEFRRYPEKGFTIVVNSNYGRGAGFEMTNAIEAVLLGLPYEVTTEQVLWFRKGMDLQRREQYREAVEYMDKCSAGPDPHLPAVYQAARTRILGDFELERAIELLDRYIELAPASVEPSVAAAWWRKGVAREQMGERDRAIANYRKSLELDPSFAQAGEALDRLGVSR